MHPRWLIPALALVVLASCKDGTEATQTPALDATPAVPTEIQPGDGVAYFAGGCFWGVEHYMEQLDGVIAVESGYMGGRTRAPSTADVSTKTTGHLETVRIRFNPEQISYHDLAKRFFEIHDPTQTDGQGPDLGPEYLSAVFYLDDEQKQITESLIEVLESRGFDVVTQVRPAGEFWMAEDRHQDHYARTGGVPYCHTRINRFGDP